MQNHKRNKSAGFKSSTGINFVLIPVLICFILYGCFSIKSADDGVQQVLIVVNTPIVNDKYELINISDTVPICFFREFEICQIPYQYLQIINGKLESEKKVYKVFIGKKGDKYGLLIDSLQASLQLNGILVLSDSILKQRAYKMELAPLQDSMKMLTPLTSANSTEEKYYFPYSVPEEYFDTVYLSYKKDMMNIKHSFSPKLDSSRKMKLCKAVFLFNRKTNKLTGKIMPERRLVYEIVPVKDPPSLEMKSLIQTIEKSFQMILDKKVLNNR
jgi:hypothetical protein